MTPALHRYRAGFSIGGPVVADRTFYYTAFEREHARGEAASDIEGATASAMNAALVNGLFPDLTTRQLTLGLFPTAREETEWSAKATQQLTGRGSLVARFALTDNHDDNDAFNAGGLSDLSARGSSVTADRAVTGSWTTTVGSRTTNDFRGQVATRRFDAHTTDQHGPGVTTERSQQLPADFDRLNALAIVYGLQRRINPSRALHAVAAQFGTGTA